LSEISEGMRELCITSQKGDRIGVRLSENHGEALLKPEGILIEVRDSGPGFDPEHFDRLFDAFHTTKPQGLGIGLTISRTIVEAHGGCLRAKPNEPRGAAFQIWLPA
jgi:signal transduction histidine kinase